MSDRLELAVVDDRPGAGCSLVDDQQMVARHQRLLLYAWILADLFEMSRQLTMKRPARARECRGWPSRGRIRRAPESRKAERWRCEIRCSSSWCWPSSPLTVSVPIIFHFRAERRKRELEHTRADASTRSSAGHIPGDRKFGLPAIPQWAVPHMIAVSIGALVPLGVFGCALLTSLFAGFQKEIWIAAGMVGLAV